MGAIIIRILGQFRNDKRSLMLLLGAPVLMLTMLYFILGDSSYESKVAIFQLPETVSSVLEDKFKVIELSDMPDKKEYLEDKKADVIVWTDKEGIHLYMLEKSSLNAKVLRVLQNMNTKNFEAVYEYKTNEYNQLDSLSYVFLGILSFFFVFILSGVSFVGERTKQTLERMMMAPLKRVEVIGGYTLGYGILAAIQSVLIILFSVYVLKLTIVGSVWLCILIMVIMAFTAVSTGSLLSIFANNELQLVQFIPIIIIPQIFYSGLIPLESIPYNLDKLCYLAPSYYACFALKEVIVFGKGIEDIWFILLELFGYLLVLFILNVVALKKYRRI